MNTQETTNSSKFILFVLTTILFVIPMLNNVHYDPQPQFWAEMTTAWIIIAIFTATTLLHKKISIPFSIIPLGLFAIYLALQNYFVSNINFIGLNYVAALEMVVGILIAVSLNSLATNTSLRQVVTVICYALLIGTILQSIIGFIQFTGATKYFGDMIFYDSSHPTTNIFGHFGQRNHYAHYLTWGTFSLIYLYSENRLKPNFFYPLLIWLCFSLTISASRSVFLYFIAASTISSIVILIKFSDTKVRKLALLIILATIILFLVQYLFPEIQKLFTHSQHNSSGLSRLESSDNVGRRGIEWQKAIITFKEYPIFGIGWNGFAKQSVLLHTLFPNAALNSGLFTNCHNLVLQLLAETGIVGAGIIFAGILICIIKLCRQNFKSEQLILLCLIATTLTHSMNEYPLWYLYFSTSLVVFISLDKPIATLQLNTIKRTMFLIPIIALSALMLHGSFIFDKLVSYYDTPDEQKEFNLQGKYLQNLTDTNILWSYYGLYTLDNYINVDTDETDNFMNINTQYHYVQKLEMYHPYPDTMMKLAMLSFSLGDKSQAESIVKLDSLAFPVYKTSFKNTLSDPYYKKLKDLIK